MLFEPAAYLDVFVASPGRNKLKRAEGTGFVVALSSSLLTKGGVVWKLGIRRALLSLLRTAGRASTQDSSSVLRKPQRLLIFIYRQEPFSCQLVPNNDPACLCTFN